MPLQVGPHTLMFCVILRCHWNRNNDLLWCYVLPLPTSWIDADMHIWCSSHLTLIVLPLVWVQRSVHMTEKKGYWRKVQRTPETHMSASTQNVSRSRTWHQHGSLLWFQWYFSIRLNIRICGLPCKGNKWSAPKQE
jgi:hypothetical protein